jgi:dihydroorotase
MTTEITITQPDDWHLHLRDGAQMQSVVAHTAAQCARAIVMPNLRPPVTTTAAALAYYDRIKAALKITAPEAEFEPLMTLYLTDNTTADEVRRAKDSGRVQGIKLYPSGATTNSDAGVSSLKKATAAIEAMQECGMPFLMHGEVVDPSIDVFDREAVFIERELIPLRRDFPGLRIVFEHLTTREAAQYVMHSEGEIAATITPQHLLYNRNALFTGGLKPHFYCLPVLKGEVHRQALLDAVASGSKRFFIGTDSAPHASRMKEAASCAAGCYSAHAALEMYAEVFDAIGALDKLEAFTSFNGADFYKLPRNTKKVRLVKQAWQSQERFTFGEGEIVPMRAGETLQWTFQA